MTDETSCQFVSSRGLLKSCDVHAMIPKSSCPTNLEYIRTFIDASASDGTSTSTGTETTRRHPVSIYVCCDAFQTFLQEYASHIRIPFTIVCGDGDKTMFRETIAPTKHNMFVMFLLHPLLRGFFSQNMDIQDCRAFLEEKIAKLWKANAAVFKHPDAPKTLDDAVHVTLSKLKQIPIGLDYHTISDNPQHRWISTTPQTFTPVEQEQILIQQIRNVKTMVPFYNRKIQIYSNVMLCPDRFRDRVSAISIIPPNLIQEQTKFIPRIDTWKNMLEYAFVLSPFGNGMDCHRTWEALLCGCIPIVRSSVFRELFEGLPVLIVDKWEDVTLARLKSTLYEFKLKHQHGEFQYEKLHLAYYTKLFHSDNLSDSHQ